LRAYAGFANCAGTSAAKNIAAIVPSATTVNFRSVFIACSSRVNPLGDPLAGALPVCFERLKKRFA